MISHSARVSALVVVLCTGSFRLGSVYAGSVAPADETLPNVRIRFSGLVAFVPYGAGVSPDAPISEADKSVDGVWAVLPRADDPETVHKLADKAHNFRLAAGALPPLHHAYIRIASKYLFEGGDDTPVYLSLGAKDPRAPKPKERSRYDIFVDGATSTQKGATLRNFPSVTPVRDAFAPLYAKATKETTSEEAVNYLKAPVVARAHFKAGQTLSVAGYVMANDVKDRLGPAFRICSKTKQGAFECDVTGPLSPLSETALQVDVFIESVKDPLLRLVAIDGSGAEHKYKLRATKDKDTIEIEVIHAPAEDVVGAPGGDHIGDSWEHFKLFYLMTAEPALRQLFVFPKAKTAGDPYCTPVAQMIISKDR